MTVWNITQAHRLTAIPLVLSCRLREVEGSLVLEVATEDEIVVSLKVEPVGEFGPWSPMLRLSPSCQIEGVVSVSF